MSNPDASQPLLSSGAISSVVNTAYTTGQSHTQPSVFAPSQSSSSLDLPPSPVKPYRRQGSKTTDEDFTPNNIRYTNWNRWHYGDLMYWGLRLSWGGFVGALTIIFALLVLLFATINLAFTSGIAPVPSYGDLLLLHFLVFSGYGNGNFVITSTAQHVLLSAESLVRTVFFTLITGMLYGRFAKSV